VWMVEGELFRCWLVSSDLSSVTEKRTSHSLWDGYRIDIFGSGKFRPGAHYENSVM
jgi:hypothetical protein